VTVAEGGRWWSPVSVFDADGDELTITTEDLPSFADVRSGPKADDDFASGR
jgi:hypothetical protein